jgi:hypothetical protein
MLEYFSLILKQESAHHSLDLIHLINNSVINICPIGLTYNLQLGAYLARSYLKNTVQGHSILEVHCIIVF